MAPQIITPYVDETLLAKLAGRSGGQTIIGGLVTSETLVLKASDADPLPIFTMTGAAGIAIDMFAGGSFTISDDGTGFLDFGTNASAYTTTIDTGTAWQFEVTTITTGKGVSIVAGGLTEGNVIEIQVDTDIVTTGKVINILSGASMATSVFNVDENGMLVIDTFGDVVGIDLSGIAAGSKIMKFAVTSNAPGDAVNISDWLEIDIAGASKFIPLYT